ncbi:hypothetical protein BV25DRAFT_1988468 [Artomyces pyxidatus]|uniref:Uncharacterized protein n=1 Tax=Artomyces pyxidatus TaxID=48021 RepID=A0ACB8TEA0_9AGAM|nr:hypothetical protein BV25DRAFT_1988468 [Artomyces pyxidatus]
MSSQVPTLLDVDRLHRDILIFHHEARISRIGSDKFRDLYLSGTIPPHEGRQVQMPQIIPTREEIDVHAPPNAPKDQQPPPPPPPPRADDSEERLDPGPPQKQTIHPRVTSVPGDGVDTSRGGALRPNIRVHKNPPNRAFVDLSAASRPNLQTQRESPAAPAPRTSAPHLRASAEAQATRPFWAAFIADIPTFTLPPDAAAAAASTVRVTRTVTAQLFGGLKSPDRPKQTRGMQALYIDRTLSPHAPPGPGRPGVVFRVSRDAQLPAHDNVFVGAGQHSAHQYCGSYTAAKAAKVPAREWRALPHKAQNVWVSRLQDLAAGRELRARIALRALLGYEPTLDEVMGNLELASTVSRKMLKEALDAGEENLYVYGLKCIAYDVALQKRLVDAMVFDDVEQSTSRKRKRDAQDV